MSKFSLKFVALTEDVLQEVKLHQEADRQPWAADLLDIEGAKLLLEKSQVDFMCQPVQGCRRLSMLARRERNRSV